MKQSNTAVIDDKTRKLAQLYVQYGQGIIADSTYKGLRGALNNCNAERLELFLTRAYKHDAAIRERSALEEEHLELLMSEATAELINDCTELGETLMHISGEISEKLDAERKSHMLTLGKCTLTGNEQKLKAWMQTAGEILLKIQDYNSPANVAKRLRIKLKAGAGLVCETKQAQFQRYLDNLDNLILLNDRVELEVWTHKAHNHLRSMAIEAIKGIPQTVGTKRRREIESAQNRFKKLVVGV